MNWEPLLARICEDLESGTPPDGIAKEEHFERLFVEKIVRDCVASHPSHGDLGIASHPWTKPDTLRPYESDLQSKIDSWRSCKAWANVEAWRMRHTLDLFVWDKTSSVHECIAIEVKFCKVTTGKMPTGEFQRMIGQSVLFLGKKDKSHKAVIAVFGVRGLSPEPLDDNGMAESLRAIGVWPVVIRVP